MATPYARTRALVLAKELLQQLADPAAPGVPVDLRSRAQALLLAYPTLLDIEAPQGRAGPTRAGAAFLPLIRYGRHAGPHQRHGGAMTVDSLLAAARDIVGGVPCFAGTRAPIARVLAFPGKGAGFARLQASRLPLPEAHAR